VSCGIRVLLVDNQDLVRAAFRISLESAPGIVGGR
jgi:DNA-binding NarL/FixJ family response regulator